MVQRLVIAVTRDRVQSRESPWAATIVALVAKTFPIQRQPRSGNTADNPRKNGPTPSRSIRHEGVAFTRSSSHNATTRDSATIFAANQPPLMVAYELRMTKAWEQVGVASPEPIRSPRSEEHTSELQSRGHLVCRLLLEK